jgi:hypothetical protein
MDSKNKVIVKKKIFKENSKFKGLILKALDSVRDKNLVTHDVIKK